MEAQKQIRRKLEVAHNAGYLDLSRGLLFEAYRLAGNAAKLSYELNIPRGDVFGYASGLAVIPPDVTQALAAFIARRKAELRR